MDVPATLNPLDWTAGPFLLLYVAVTLAAFAAVAILRHRLGPSPDAVDDLGLLELAWLSGGPAHAADTVLLCFLTAGAAEIDTIRTEIRFVTVPAGASAAWPDIREAFRYYAVANISRRMFHHRVRQELEAIRQRIVQRGLVDSPADLARFRVTTWRLLAIPLLLGVSKIIVGASRGKPVGILVVLVVTTLVITILRAYSPARLNRAGRAALKRATRRNARAVRAPLQEEVALAFALSGAQVLAGTPFATFVRLLPRDRGYTGDTGGSGSCGGDGGGSDGSGGGCGGCSSSAS